MTDPRITDRRVKVARRENWLVGEDPAPEYSALDARDGLRPYTADVVLPRPVRADSLRTPGSVIQEPPHSMFEPMRRLYWVLAVVPVVGVVAVALLFWRWVA